MIPLGLYVQVVCKLGARILSHFRSTARVLRSVRSPWVDRVPAVALPLLYSITSGAALELRIRDALDWMVSNAFRLVGNRDARVRGFELSIAALQDWPMALSADS